MRSLSPLFLVFLVVLGVAGTRPPAASAAQPRILADPVANDECGACHMPYPPRFLPKSSWKRIMANLENHFGGDASLDPETRDHIAAFYARYGAERGDDVLRITETWWWRRAHRYEIPTSVWTRVGSPANCLACHRASGRGNDD